MKAIIINIGNELLNGSTLNRNGHWLAGELYLRGVECTSILSIQDGYTPLESTLDSIPALPEWVFVSGGLGPTPDDTTRFDIARYLNLPMEEHAELFTDIEKILGIEKAKEFKKENLSQICFPLGAQVLANSKGTAPGFLLKHKNSTFVFTPGVPFEMQHILQTSIFPIIEDKNGFYRREVRTYGIGESLQTKLLSDLQIPSFILFASLPGKSELLTRVSGTKDQKKEIDQFFEQILLRLQTKPDAITSVDGLPILEEVIRKLASLPASLAVAESCTGGLLGSWITEIAGTSQIFKGGVIAYSNELKQNLLKVQKHTLLEFGAVSEECALEMAEGARLQCNSDFGISITGIAGPTGGSPEKPVGTVCFGFSSKLGKICETKIFRGDRERVRERAASYALVLLHKNLNK